MALTRPQGKKGKSIQSRLVMLLLFILILMWFKRNGHLDKSTLSESEVSYEQQCNPSTIHPAIQG